MSEFYWDNFAEEYVKANERSEYAPPERYIKVTDPQKSIKYMEDKIEELKEHIKKLKS